jgi:hypothetical protein
LGKNNSRYNQARALQSDQANARHSTPYRIIKFARIA